MPIQSMTGFGKGESQGEKFSISVEMKTVNNRFKDVRFKMSSMFNALELPLKKRVDTIFKRGSFDIYVQYKKNPEFKSAVELDFDKIEKFITSFKKVSDNTGVAINFTPTDFFKADFYVEDESKTEELGGLLESAFDIAMVDLEKSRIEEGDKLVLKLEEHLSIYQDHYSKIMIDKECYQEKLKEKFLKRFEESASGLNVDEPRFLQEVIYYLEKLDFDEEVNRIAIHIEKLTSTFKSKGEIGRQIDFLVQELNRETNTIGSKSGSSQISENVVQMKVQLEKIREQALNLE